ncbi:MAG TPA: CerR family C-terminal domain-containing protein, partial [Novosphingobium sp.]|nr:CerR family C-terminal domain-containing protein [Novosphingobium sp.]
IAAAAGMPMSQITYHFGGKEGLYLGCAQMIAEAMGRIIGSTLVAVEAELAAASAPPMAARAGLRQLLGAMAEAMLDPETRAFSRFMLREQAEPTRAFAIIYGGAMGRVLALLERLIVLISGKDGIAAKVEALALVGQITVFRVAQAGVLEFTGWGGIGPAEVAIIRQTILGNVDVICAALGRSPDEGGRQE